jgi:hypothetical protein
VWNHGHEPLNSSCNGSLQQQWVTTQYEIEGDNNIRPKVCLKMPFVP